MFKAGEARRDIQVVLEGRLELYEIKSNGGVISVIYSISPGAFTDVRADSVKRVASAAGEGAAVVADVHLYLARHSET